MVRPLRAETERYGHYSVAGEDVYEHPFLWGSKRTGPDLARVGGRYSDDWHRAHLNNPRSVVPQSNMPALSVVVRHAAHRRTAPPRNSTRDAHARRAVHRRRHRRRARCSGRAHRERSADRVSAAPRRRHVSYYRRRAMSFRRLCNAVGEPRVRRPARAGCCSPRNKARPQSYASIPLEDDDPAPCDARSRRGEHLLEPLHHRRHARLARLDAVVAAVESHAADRRPSETTGHDFDGIEEYDNPLPLWWVGLFVATIVFARRLSPLLPRPRQLSRASAAGRRTRNGKRDVTADRSPVRAVVRSVSRR